MFLALTQMRRAKVRFGLLAGAVGFVVFLSDHEAPLRSPTTDA